MLSYGRKPERLTVRKGLEGWPLLCETPLEGGNTSRYVGTSMERIEFTATAAFSEKHRIFVQGREMVLGTYPGSECGAGLRYRRTALRPSLHPALPPHMPLIVTITDRAGKPAAAFELQHGRRIFVRAEAGAAPLLAQPCAKMRPHLLTYDLRVA